MVPEIIWSELAERTFQQNIDYLRAECSDAVVDTFTNRTLEVLTFIQGFPNGGRLINKSQGHRRFVIHERILLIYRYEKREHRIELVRFFNTYQSPSRLKDNL